MGGVGVVVDSSIFGLVRKTGAFTGGILTFTLVSGLQVAQRNCDTYHFFSVSFSSQLESMVGGALARSSALLSWVSVGRLSHLDRALAHRIRVMGGYVIWVWWVSR